MQITNYDYSSLTNVSNCVQEFLTSYNPLMNVPDDKLTRWHQNFDVDAVDDIPITSLPQAPQIKTFVTAQDVLGTTHNCILQIVF